ncbi:MAG: alpha/beta hydrolase [Byssovorax sp.]
MRADTFTVVADDDKELFVHRFLPDEGTAAKAIVHIAHGMAEHGARYARAAEALTRAGYVVYADDHRGHGQTAKGELGYIAESGGFYRVVKDLALLIAREKKDNPGLPAVLFGHSMGSYYTQAFLIEHGKEIAGAVLSATSGKPSLLASAGRVFARIERLRLGSRGKSTILNKLSFDQFNVPFKPNRTAFDWLSRDPAEVDKYVADPLCGFICTTSLWVDLLDTLGEIADPQRQRHIPSELPVYVFCGTEDPVGERTKSVDQLLGAYRAAGLHKVTHRYYLGGRHGDAQRDEPRRVTKDSSPGSTRISLVLRREGSSARRGRSSSPQNLTQRRKGAKRREESAPILLLASLRSLRLCVEIGSSKSSSGFLGTARSVERKTQPYPVLT